ncbi:SRPBCC family protein [Spirillospora sp. CA-253888]
MADRTSSSITIDAGRKEIMAVIADLPAYPTWANGIRDFQVLETGADGRAATARMTIDASPFSDTVGLAYTWGEDDEWVRWELTEKGSVVTSLHGSYLLAEGKDGTVVTYELAVDIRMPVIGMLKRKAEKRITDLALKGLKRRVEAG